MKLVREIKMRLRHAWLPEQRRIMLVSFFQMCVFFEVKPGDLTIILKSERNRANRALENPTLQNAKS